MYIQENFFDYNNNGDPSKKVTTLPDLSLLSFDKISIDKDININNKYYYKL